MARRTSRQREEVMNRIITSVTLASGGVAAAASLAMGVATADPDATTISVPDPFGVTFVGAPDITYQIGDASEGIAYGQQTLDFDSTNFGQSVDQFFTSNVTVDGQPLNLTTNPLNADLVSADIIDKLQSDGEAQQQILLPAISGTNIDSGVIGIHNFGEGYAYEYIDLVGPGTTSLNSNGVDQAIGAWLVTPTGTYDVSQWEDGGDYGNLAYQESQLFDLSNPVPDPFGSLTGDPDITYQTGDVFANTAYGSQTFDFDSNDLPSFVQQFFTSNVTVDDNPLNLSTNPLIDSVPANVIDKVDFNGLFNGFADQQILLPSIAGTNIDSGVIDIENLGNGYSYDYIDLVGPGTAASNGVENAIGAWLVTPDATYDVSALAGVESLLFDASNFTAMFPDAALTPLPLDFLF
jgi:hypothetical protein